LETTAVTERLEKLLGLIEREISVLQVEKRIRTRVKRQMEKTQREFFLHEQMKAIQKELGDEEGKDELVEIEDKIKKTKLSKEAREKATHELKKLRQMSPMSAESTVVRNYLDWLLSIPWAREPERESGPALAASETQDAGAHLLGGARRCIEAERDHGRVERGVGKLLEPVTELGRQELGQHEIPQEHLHQQRDVAEQFHIGGAEPDQPGVGRSADDADERSHGERQAPRAERGCERPAGAEEERLQIGVDPVGRRLEKDAPVPVV